MSAITMPVILSTTMPFFPPIIPSLPPDLPRTVPSIFPFIIPYTAHFANASSILFAPNTTAPFANSTSVPLANISTVTVPFFAPFTNTTSMPAIPSANTTSVVVIKTMTTMVTKKIGPPTFAQPGTTTTDLEPDSSSLTILAAAPIVTDNRSAITPRARVLRPRNTVTADCCYEMKGPQTITASASIICDLYKMHGIQYPCTWTNPADKDLKLGPLWPDEKVSVIGNKLRARAVIAEEEGATGIDADATTVTAAPDVAKHASQKRELPHLTVQHSYICHWYRMHAMNDYPCDYMDPPPATITEAVPEMCDVLKEDGFLYPCTWSMPMDEENDGLKTYYSVPWRSDVYTMATA